MRESQFIQLLKTLDKKEQLAFKNYVKGLYSKKKKIIQLLEYVLKFNPSFTSEKLKRNYINNHVFTTDAFLDKNLSNLNSGLKIYLEEFLRWQKIQHKTENFEKGKLMLDIYKERRLDKIFHKEVDKIIKKIERSPLDVWHNYHLMHLNYEKFFYTPTQKLKVSDEELTKTKYYLELFYRNAYIKLTTEESLRKLVLKDALPVKNSYSQTPDSFYDSYQLLQDLFSNSTNLSYDKIKEKVFQNLENLDEENQLVTTIYLLQYAINQIKTGNLNFVTEIFELYKHLVESKLLFIDGYISHTDFNNIVEVSCKSGEHEWGKMFIENYVDYLADFHKEETIKIGQAIIHFEEENFVGVVAKLNEVSFSIIDHALRARWLLLCSLFELKDTSYSIEAFANAFEQFLRREKTLNDTTIRGSLNLIKIIRKMLKNRDKAKLLTEVQQTTPLFYKAWLLKKLKASPKI